jgi:hypothetical protein
MFGNLISTVQSFFGGLAAKVMFGLCIALVVLAYFFYQQNERNAASLTRVQGELTIKEASLKELQGDFDRLKKSQKIDENTQTVVVTETIQLKASTAEVNKLVSAQVSDIRKKYQDLEQTAANKQAADEEVSVARITGLWTTYCLSHPQHANCKKPEGDKK